MSTAVILGAAQLGVGRTLLCGQSAGTARGSRMKTRALGIAVAVAVFSGCSHLVALQPPGTRVTIVTAAPSQCNDAGEVFGKSNADDSEEAMVGARNDLRNRAGAKGATHVVLETNNNRAVMGNWGRGIEVLLGGRALKCPAN
jgi:hypothetical protein